MDRIFVKGGGVHESSELSAEIEADYQLRSHHWINLPRLIPLTAGEQFVTLRSRTQNFRCRCTGTTEHRLPVITAEMRFQIFVFN